mmetsp:Transcript_95174/g.246422  ORF Transcript_95174/g.246422 Transcript_95174/m.246422 type:complete len:237 (-) Transcript_95174:126-836(-)
MPPPQAPPAAAAAARAAAEASGVALRAKRLDTTPTKEGRSPFYSTLDRERMARRRQQVREMMREKRRSATKTTQTLNYEMLPSVEDIYSRQFTGNATVDPIGGRKRYTLTIFFKHDPQKAGPEILKKSILGYIDFFRNRMSCRSVTAKSMLSPIDGRSPVTSLEYPMKEYGEVPKGEKMKKVYHKAVLVKFEMFAPPAALEYIQKRIYKDNMILRYMLLGHTRSFMDFGEDNELHL